MFKKWIREFAQDLEWERIGPREYQERTTSEKVKHIQSRIQNVAKNIGNSILRQSSSAWPEPDYRRFSNDRILLIYHHSQEKYISPELYLGLCEEIIEEYRTLFQSSQNIYSLEKGFKIYIADTMEKLETVSERECIGFAVGPEQSIYISLPELSTPSETIRYFAELTRHELSHLFSWAVNHSLPQSIEEGFAVYLQPVERDIEIHRKAKSYLLYGDICNIFLTQDSIFMSDDRASIHYTLSGSFTDYLIREYGIENYLNFYERVNSENIINCFSDIFPNSYRIAETNWKKFVKAVD